MKVLFLDIDGVLNSYRYDSERPTDDCNNIDETRLPLLKQLVDMTGAHIVLSSSWRAHWQKDETLCDEKGKELVSVLSRYGLRIFDKTHDRYDDPEKRDRGEEIQTWLDAHRGEVEAFVIIDDDRHLGDLCHNLVSTNYRIGRGLEMHHIEKALAMLQGAGE